MSGAERVGCAFVAYRERGQVAGWTQRLGVSPTVSHEVGQPVVLPSGRVRHARIGRWELDSEEHVDAPDFAAHLEWLLALLEPSADVLPAMAREDTVRMAVRVIWWSADGRSGPRLSAHHARRLAGLGLELQFWFSYYGDDADDE